MKKSVRKALAAATLAIATLATTAATTLHHKGRSIVEERANTPEKKLELKQRFISEVEIQIREKIKTGFLDRFFKFSEPVLNLFGLKPRNERKREIAAEKAAREYIEEVFSSEELKIEVEGSGLNLIDALIAHYGGKANMFKNFNFQIIYKGEIIVTFKVDDNWNPYGVIVNERTKFYNDLYKAIKNAAMGRNS